MRNAATTASCIPHLASRHGYPSAMLWAQVAVSFACWIGYGAVAARRTGQTKAFLDGRSRAFKAIWAAVLLLLSAGLLLGAFHYLSQTEAVVSQLSIAIWLLLTVFGLIFVAMQTFAFAMVVSIVQEDVAAAKKAASSKQSSGGTLKP